MKRTLLSFLAMAAMSATAMAADIKPAIIYDLGGKFDKSFNEAAFNGAEKFKTETGIEYRDFEIANDAQREQALRRFAKDGNNPIVMAGFSWASALEKIAAEYPDTNFAIIDMVVDKPNVRSVVYKEQEGSYLVGVAAAMASKSKKLGFVGGMDIPLIRAFACGYTQGAKAQFPKVEIMQNMVGTTAAAWNDPAKGGELARAQFDRGADVVFAVAGGSGMGALQMAKTKGKLAIGVDSNQNYLHPGTMLTSMVKRVDNAVYESFMAQKNGTWKAGVTHKGLKEGGVDWVLDKDNRKLVSPEMEKRVNAVRTDIINGKIKVIDYRTAGSGPV